MKTGDSWFVLQNAEVLDTPAVAVYPDRVIDNIKTLVNSIDDVKRLRPHVKTHKSAEVTAMMLAAGIKKFKCATISEAEMLGTVGAPDVLLAYQPVGPKAVRLADLVQRFPKTAFSCLIDNATTAKQLSDIFLERKKTIPVYIDLNVGMNRTGIIPNDALVLFKACEAFEGITIVGLHAYDGHLRDTDMSVRTQRCDEAFASVEKLQADIRKESGKTLTIVAGGTPTYSIHSKRKTIECSPGTYIYWDSGYASTLKEQDYKFAALVVTRVISKPAPGIICVDLGHKSIASENPLTSRVTFLNGGALQPTGHSEEHMVLKVEDGKEYAVGDVLYGVPYHICPTIALHDRVAFVEDQQVKGYWSTLSRNRKITV